MISCPPKPLRSYKRQFTVAGASPCMSPFKGKLSYSHLSRKSFLCLARFYKQIKASPWLNLVGLYVVTIYLIVWTKWLLLFSSQIIHPFLFFFLSRRQLRSQLKFTCFLCCRSWITLLCRWKLTFRYVKEGRVSRGCSFDGYVDG